MLVEPKTLYIVATPIGNREDVSLRALEVLKEVDAILAEDTRHSSALLNLLGIQKPMMSFHAHNEDIKSDPILQSLQKGNSFALISDAGTPLINDPGYPLVKIAREAGIAVVPIPGPCALITALSAAGVPADTFTFAGFLPAKAGARRKRLGEFQSYPQTLIFYESPHRIIESIQDFEVVFGADCQLVLAKELTKAHENFISGSPQTILDWLNEDPRHSKGEFVIIVSPRTLEKPESKSREVLSSLLKELPLKQAVKVAAEIIGENKNYLYKLALEMQEGTG